MACTRLRTPWCLSSVIIPPLMTRTDFIGNIGGGVPTVAISGTLAYMGEGTQLTILNTSNPAAPARIASATSSA